MITDVRKEQTYDGVWIAFKVPLQSADTIFSKATEYLSKGKKFSLNLKLERRSLDANAYMWVLLGKLSQVLNIPSDEIYRNMIKDIGAFTIFPTEKSKQERIIEMWESRGIGWICEDLGECKNFKDYNNIKYYYGSSTYNTAEMSKLIDLVVTECKLQGIETMTPNELLELKENWR